MRRPRPATRQWFQLFILVLGVSLLTAENLFAQVACRSLFASGLKTDSVVPGVDFVWLLYAPRAEQDAAYRDELKRSENRPRFPTPGGQRGLGIGEEAVSVAYDRLPSVVRSLMSAHADAFTPAELELLGKIGEMIKLHPKLEFVSEKLHPGFFDGPESKGSPAHRLARTELKPGATISMNADQLSAYRNRVGDQAYLVPATLIRFLQVDHMAQMLGILIHELGHHTGAEDTPDRPLDVLGSKVAQIFADNSKLTTVPNADLPYMGFMHSNLESPSRTGETGQVLAALPEHLFDLTEMTRDQLQKTFGTSVTGIWMQGFHWEPVGQWDLVHQAQPFAAQGTLVFRTEDQELHEVPVRWMMLVSHPGNMDQAYERRNNWKGSPGFIPTSGNYERLVALEILKKEVKPYGETPLLENPTRVTTTLVTATVKPGEPWSGQLGLKFAKPVSGVKARVVLSSEEFSFGSHYKPFQMDVPQVYLHPTSDLEATLYFTQTFGAETVSRKLGIDKILLEFPDGHVEEVRPPQKATVQILGAPSKIAQLGFGIGPTAQNIRGPTIKGIPVKERIEYWKWPLQPEMELPLYMDFEHASPHLLRAEMRATLHYRAADGLIKNVNAVVNLLDPSHPWLKGASVERLANGTLRVHFKMVLPKLVGGRPAVQLSFQNVHLIDDNLDEVVHPIQVSITPP